MTNPLIDALVWNPDNTSASIRALQTALMSLQTEWATKLPQLGQISRDGLVVEADWQSLILQNGLDADRADSSFLHFDNVNQEFEGQWANIYGEITQQAAVADSGKVERFSLNVITNYRTIGTSLGSVVSQAVVLKRSAKLNIFLPVMVNRTAGANNITFTVRIGGVDQYSVVFAPTTGTWTPLFFHWIHTTLSPATVSVELSAICGAATTCDVADIAPLPNITGAAPNGIITPYLGYAEAIYQ